MLLIVHLNINTVLNNSYRMLCLYMEVNPVCDAQQPKFHPIINNLFLALYKDSDIVDWTMYQ